MNILYFLKYFSRILNYDDYKEWLQTNLKNPFGWKNILNKYLNFFYK